VTDASAPLGELDPLPGELALDQTMVDEAVGELGWLFLGRGLETALRVGNCALRRFFGGDYRAYRLRSSSHLSFRSLARRSDLAFSYSYLRNAVVLAGQVPQLPAELARSLSLSHHLALSPLLEPADRVELAREALREGLSSSKLRVRVRARTDQRRRGPRKGRRPLPPGVGRLRRVAASLREEPREPMASAVLAEHFTEHELRRLVAALERQLSELQAVLPAHDSPSSRVTAPNRPALPVEERLHV